MAENIIRFITKTKADKCLLICVKLPPTPIFCKQKIGCNF